MTWALTHERSDLPTRLLSVWIQRPDFRCQFLKLVTRAASKGPLKVCRQAGGDVLCGVLARVTCLSSVYVF